MSNPRPSTSGGPGSSSAITGAPRKGIKRPGPPILNGIVETWEEKTCDYLCSICFEIFHEAHITRCGHTFCYQCIIRTIEANPRCPKCGCTIQKEHLVPNFLLNQLVAKVNSGKHIKTEMAEAIKDNTVPTSDVRQFMMSHYNDLDLNDLDVLLTMLRRRKEVLTTEAVEHQRTLLKDFLSQLLKAKRAEKDILDRAVTLIERDLTYMSSSGTPCKSMSSNNAESSNSSSDEGLSLDSNSSSVGFNTQMLKCLEMEQTSLAARRRRMSTHFIELCKMYFEVREAVTSDIRVNDAMVPSGREKPMNYEPLDVFGQTLSRISRYYGLKPLATLSYSADLVSNSNIVSSIEFDKDNEYFAIAGVTRKIKLFEYANVIGSSVDIHCPSAELSCGAKISCVAWSSYYKNYLASSDYDGCVSLWDASAVAKTRSLSEHEKRVWSVDWSNGDPRLLASGSDDSKVKLWSTNVERSVANLEAKANVCCVKFCPENSFTLAFGSADHCVHYYDFRNPREPIGVLYGHKKAVSYVKFASKYELVSASTDSHLKLWNLQTKDEVRSFQGHINEKNFVGLATDGNFIACGSENNSLYVYYKSLPHHLFSFKFDNHRSMLDKPKSDESTEFVSAVAWKKGSPIVVAANSQGAIKILELV